MTSIPMLRPGLNPHWSTTTLRGGYHTQDFREIRAAWQDAPHRGIRALVALQAVRPALTRTLNMGVAAVDRLLCGPVHVVGAAVGAGCSLSKEAARKLAGKPTPGCAAAAHIGAAMGTTLVRRGYAALLRLCLAVVAAACALTDLPAALLLWLTGAQMPAPRVIRTLEVRPMGPQDAVRLLERLDGAGGPWCSFEEMRFTQNPATGSIAFEGTLRATLGLMFVSTFSGHITCDHGAAQDMAFHFPAAGALHAINFSFFPSLQGERLLMTGTAEGLHYAEHEPTSRLLTGLGFEVKHDRWTAQQAEQHPVQRDCAYRPDTPLDDPNHFVSCARGQGAVGLLEQKLTCNGGWDLGYSMGKAEMRSFPFAAAAELGLGLKLDF